MTDFLLGGLILLLLGAAIAYIVKEKRRGARCIGCPHSGSCSRSKQKEAGSSGVCTGCQAGIK